jgi:Na+/H+-dicarboxylate symporter
MKLGKSLTTGIIAALVAGLLLGSIISASGNSALASAVGWIEPLGELWVNAIRMTVVPLVVALLIGGIASVAAFEWSVAYPLAVPSSLAAAAPRR